MIQQRSQFVTSKYRHKLNEALDFRNRFATRPYLTKELVEEQTEEVYVNHTRKNYHNKT